MAIATKVVSSTPIYKAQHYVIQFVSDLCWVVCFFQILLCLLQIKLTATI